MEKRDLYTDQRRPDIVIPEFQVTKDLHLEFSAHIHVLHPMWCQPPDLLGKLHLSAKVRSDGSMKRIVWGSLSLSFRASWEVGSGCSQSVGLLLGGLRRMYQTYWPRTLCLSGWELLAVSYNVLTMVNNMQGLHNPWHNIQTVILDSSRARE